MARYECTVCGFAYDEEEEGTAWVELPDDWQCPVCGCQQYRIRHTGRCPVGITTHDPELRDRLDIELSARRLENSLRVSTHEIEEFARLTGHDDVHGLGLDDLCTTSSEIANHTEIQHAAVEERR